MKIEIKLTKGPITGPTFLEIDMSKRQYSQPKLYIPKINGKPTIEKQWYVWFLWRNPETDKLDMKFKYKKGINRYKSVQERKEIGKALVEGYKEALERGWNPITKTAAKSRSSRGSAQTVEKALKYALQIKSTTKKEPTMIGYEFHLNRFLEWAKKHGYLGLDVQKFSIDHFYEFLDWIRFEYVKDDGEALSGTSINNYKRSLSSLFTTLKNERLIPFNFIKDIPAVDEDPINNKAFTVEQIREIKTYLEKEDPYLIHFISFILYPLLRPREICRLKVKDINFEKGFLSVETKTDALSYRRIIEKMKPTVKALAVEKYPKNCHLFTNSNEPKVWEEIKLKGKVDHFGNRFKAVKNALGYGREYGLYSFRHTAIMDLFHSLQKKGMGEQEILFELMPITQHKSIAGIKNYLRKHQQSVPPDHSDIYTIDF